jgi:excinuclease ABC subunit A
VGLDYLTLDRSADTLSGGEAQRIRLASQIGSGLVGVMYILDEPSIGLHQRDNERLLATLHAPARPRQHGDRGRARRGRDPQRRLRRRHGPGAGAHGGEIVAQGTPVDIIAAPRSLTGDYLAGRRAIACRRAHATRPQAPAAHRGARGNNLKNVTRRSRSGC